ncbi:hypothetical protein Hanom_Chr14g01335591 [Helianthus anomalus]
MAGDWWACRNLQELIVGCSSSGDNFNPFTFNGSIRHTFNGSIRHIFEKKNWSQEDNHIRQVLIIMRV